MNNQLSVRANIILTLEKINQGQSLSVLLDPLLNSLKDNEKGFAHQLLLGTLRQWHALNRIGERLIKQPPNDIGVICALNMGLYELLYMNTPDYAVINETLNAVKSLNKDYATGLINALLRKVADKKDKFAKKLQKNHSLPNWLAYQLKQDWAEYYDTLGQRLREPAPLFVRFNNYQLNGAKIQTDKALGKSDDIDVGVAFGGGDIDDDYVGRSTNVYHAFENITHWADFKEGKITIQDRHAQLAGSIADAIMTYLTWHNTDKTYRLLDACTAPAGKLTHWLDCLFGDDYPPFDFELTAIDNDQNRLNKVYDNVKRLGFNELIGDKLHIQCANATTFKSAMPYDVIMLDAPCSATGVIRRHPDIGLLRQPDDISNIMALQRQILDNLWQSLAVGGYLLYITCSMLKAENVAQMTAFLERHTNAKEIKLICQQGIEQAVGIQYLPLKDNDGDGFYYALLQKH